MEAMRESERENEACRREGVIILKALTFSRFFGILSFDEGVKFSAVNALMWISQGQDIGSTLHTFARNSLVIWKCNSIHKCRHVSQES